MLASDNAPKPGRHVPRRLGPDELRQEGQPIANLRRLVVDDVVDGSRPPTLHGQGSRVRRILDVDERPPALAAADHGGVPLSDLVDEQAIEETRIDSVKRAIAKDYSLKVRPSRHKVFKIPDSLERATKLSWWMWIECISLRFYRRSLAGVGPATVALCNNALDRCFTRGSKQMVKAWGAKAVAGRKHLIELAQIRRAAEVRHLVNDHVGPDGPNDLAHLGSIESIDNGGLAAELSDLINFRRAPRGTDDLMTGRNQPRHEVSTQGTRGAGNEDTHVVFSFMGRSFLSPIETSTH